MLLTTEERIKFVKYLELDAESDKLIIEQMEKTKVPDALIKKLKNEMIASLIIANKLRNTESQSVSP